MLSSCSPSATLLNASVPPGGAFHSSGSLVFAATAQGMPLNQLALVAGGACIPGSFQSNVAVGRTVLGQVPPPRHCTDSRLGHPLPSPVFL